MWQLSAIVFFVATNYLSESMIGALRYGGNGRRPFREPGEIMDGVRVDDVMDTVGRVWNAENLGDGAELICEEFEPALANILQYTTAPVIVHTVCDAVRNSQIEEACNDVWDGYVGQVIGDGVSVSLIYGSYVPCRFRHENYYETQETGWNSSSSYVFFGGDNYTTSYTHDMYPTLFDLKLVAAEVYDFCSEDGQGIGKVNNMIFAVMDWLGPSVFNSLYQYNMDINGLCSLGRYAMTMDPTDFIDKVFEIFMYPLADILEYFKDYGICKSADNFGVELLKNLLVEFSGTSKVDFCEFISEEHTREKYLEKANTILGNVKRIVSEEKRCKQFLSILASLDEEGLHVQYIGFDLRNSLERIDFCQQVIGAFSPNSTYEPSPYNFPSDFDISDWQPFSSPGEILPGLDLIDLLEIEGATLRAETIMAGMGVYCTVFSGFFSQFVYEAYEFCNAIRSRLFVIIELRCQMVLAPLNHYNVPLGFKPFNPIPFAIYLSRNLTGIFDISKDEICPAVDDLFNNRSLKDLVLNGLEVFIAESLPSLHSVCKNWEEVVCYWKPFCVESNYESSGVPFATTENPLNRIYNRQSWESSYEAWMIEYVTSSQSRFDEILSEWLSLILIAADFDERETFCDVVAYWGIDPLSGRSDPGFVEELTDNVYGLLTNVQRCTEFVDTALGGLIAEENLGHILTDRSRSNIYQLTGFTSSVAFCEALSDDFSGGTSISPKASESSKPMDTYDFLVKIAVYLKNNVPFPL